MSNLLSPVLAESRPCLMTGRAVTVSGGRRCGGSGRTGRNAGLVAGGQR
jgi:hypothetical protein